MAVNEKIRIKIKGYEHAVVDAAAAKIVDAAKRSGAQVSGPIPLPTDKEIITILRAVHKYKDSREQFELRTHKRLIDVIRPAKETMAALEGLELPAGVKGIIGKKIGMTQIFDETGKVIPVTVVEAGPCVVVQKKTTENDGYEAVQLGYGDIRAKRVSKPLAGHFAKAGVAQKRTLKEFRFDDTSALNVGDLVKADTFAEGDIVDVSGTSKGHGFTGTIKRHNNARLKETHGTGPVHRHAGSMGACSSPSRIYKGKGMPGQMGNEKVTVQNLTVVKVDAENNLIAIKGAIPGPKNGTVVLTDAIKKKA